MCLKYPQQMLCDIAIIISEICENFVSNSVCKHMELPLGMEQMR